MITPTVIYLGSNPHAKQPTTSADRSPAMSMSPRRRLTDEDRALMRSAMMDLLIERAIDHLAAHEIEMVLSERVLGSEVYYESCIVEFAMAHGMPTTTHELRLTGLMPVALQV